MKHLIFDVAAGGVTGAELFQLACDEAFGYPRGPEIWNQHFSDVVINVAGQDDPNSPNLKAAIDISNKYAPAGQDYENEALYVFPLDLVAQPDGTVVDDDFDMNDPLWTKPFGGP
jgi:hypothetical protein